MYSDFKAKFDELLEDDSFSIHPRNIQLFGYWNIQIFEWTIPANNEMQCLRLSH